MGQIVLTDQDIKQIRSLGISEEQVMKQIEIFEKGPPFLRLNRPCTVGDGIRAIEDDNMEDLKEKYLSNSPSKDLIKFVPASGAATRMFRTLLRFHNKYQKINRDMVESKARQGDDESQYMLTFMDGINRFAFYEDLEKVMAKDGLDTDLLVRSGRFKEIIDYLLTEKGLNYASLPKGLLKFHRYPDGSRTPFEEHLVEASDYVKDINGISHLHFTVSPQHQEKFQTLYETIKGRYEERWDALFQVDFSVQKRSTDTIAVDMENRPFRLEDGTILFRPGGHGALIDNLNNLKGDIIFIKNIDNVVPDRLKPPTFLWKKILGGLLILTQEKIFYYINRLEQGENDKALLKEVMDFVRKDLCITPPTTMDLTSEMETRKFLINVLNRPIRVCGMVKNVGEPGGGPFWVEDDDGSLSLQIVEKAQVDMSSEEQRKIFAASTHFNPVDIVCGVRDWQGRPFDLKKYVDPNAVFISKKSKDGRDLKALELPGLWNGAMAYWNTIFVEVPLVTFNPVKTVNDLLRKEHQPED